MFIKTQRAYCPSSLSLFFKVCPNENLVKMGSIGAGFTIDSGVTATVSENSITRIYFNGRMVKLPTVLSAINSLFNKQITIKIISKLPLGFGFGISAASTLASLWAANSLFKLGKNDIDLAKIAHIAEIRNKTGLGSVGTQITGGFLLKISPGIPVKKIAYPFEGKKIYTINIGPIQTSSVLKDDKYIQEINSAANKLFIKLTKSKRLTFENILDESFRFAKETHLLQNQEIIEIIEKIKKNGGHATISMIGQTIISDVKPDFYIKYPLQEHIIIHETVRLLNNEN